MVDADTIIHPNCPNFFDLTDNKYCGVMNEGDYEWVLRSIKGFGNVLFDNKQIKPWNYINGGFQIVNINHKIITEQMYEKINNHFIEKLE